MSLRDFTTQGRGCRTARVVLLLINGYPVLFQSLRFTDIGNRFNAKTFQLAICHKKQAGLRAENT